MSPLTRRRRTMYQVRTPRSERRRHRARAASDVTGDTSSARRATTRARRAGSSAWRVVSLACWLLLLASGCAIFAAVTPPARYSESARRLEPGPYKVESAKVVFEDAARGRTLVSTLWWPVAAVGPVPLVVQAHGFLANRSGGAYVAEHLASHGYVVVAATHPNTTLFAPGGAKVGDVIQQPGDVSFLIDRLLADDGEGPTHPPIDPTRIAVMGHSLGGLTATLTAFHPRLRDRRVAAAISIAGPMEMFEPTFFATAPVPFMMIAGSDDVIVGGRDGSRAAAPHHDARRDGVPREPLRARSGRTQPGPQLLDDDPLAGFRRGQRRDRRRRKMIGYRARVTRDSPSRGGRSHG
jgi:dienelactone hydrolase